MAGVTAAVMAAVAAAATSFGHIDSLPTVRPLTDMDEAPLTAYYIDSTMCLKSSISIPSSPVDGSTFKRIVTNLCLCTSFYHLISDQLVRMLGPKRYISTIRPDISSL